MYRSTLYILITKVPMVAPDEGDEFRKPTDVGTGAIKLLTQFSVVGT